MCIVYVTYIFVYTSADISVIKPTHMVIAQRI